MLTLISQYKYVIYIGAALVIFFAGWFKGYSGEHDKFIAYQSQVKQIGEEQAKVSEEKDRQNEQTRKDIENAYQIKLNSVNDYWSKRMLHTSSSALPKIPTTSTGANDTASNPLPNYPKLIQDCASTTVQLEALQSWIIKTR